jgi:hypothetical protein
MEKDALRCGGLRISGECKIYKIFSVKVGKNFSLII